MPDIVAFDWPSLTPRAMGVLVFFGVATSVVAYVLWTMLLRRLGAVGCAVLINLQPLAVGLLAWPMLGERITTELFAGGALIKVGKVMPSSSAPSPLARAPGDPSVSPSGAVPMNSVRWPMVLRVTVPPAMVTL